MIYRLSGEVRKRLSKRGVVNGIVYEMDGYIDELKVKYPDLFGFFNRRSFVFILKDG